MQDKYKIDYDLKKPQYQTIGGAKFKQGNLNTSELEITIFDNGIAADITGESIEFRFLKPDGKTVFQNFAQGVTITDAANGIVNCVLMTETLQATGICKCEIYRELEGKELTMPSFTFLIEKSMGEGSLSVNYIGAIENKIIEWGNQVTAYLDWDWTGPQGEQGIQGIQGPIGPQGIPGELSGQEQLDELKTKIASVASGSPKGTYATVGLLTTAFPIGNTNIYIVTLDGTWRYWNGSIWESGGIYQSTGLDEKIILSTNMSDEFYEYMEEVSFLKNIDSEVPANLLWGLSDGVDLLSISTHVNDIYFSSINLGSSTLTTENKINVTNDTSTGYLFYKLKAIEKLAPGNMFSVAIKLVEGTLLSNKARVRITNSSGVDTGKGYVFLKEIGLGWFGLIGEIIPENAYSLEFRLDNRQGTENVIFEKPIFVSGSFIGPKNNSLDKAVVDISYIYNLITPNLFTDPLLFNKEWINYGGVDNAYGTYDIESIDNNNVLTIRTFEDNTVGIAACGFDIDLKNSILNIGDKLVFGYNIVDIFNVTTTNSGFNVCIISYNDNSEINRLTVKPKLGKNTHTYTIPLLATKIRFRFDGAGAGGHIQINNLYINKIENTDKKMPITTDIYTMKKMLNDLKDNLSTNKPALYVTLEGSDTNTGLSLVSGLATINRAVELGGRVIICERGNYYNQGWVNVAGLDSIVILPTDATSFDKVYQPNLNKIRIIGADKMTLLTLDSTTGLYKQAYATNNFYNKVFITKELPIETVTSRPSYNAILWEGNDKVTDVKLIPKLTIAEVQATVGSFTWDGANVYINPIGGTIEGKEYHAVKAGGNFTAFGTKQVILEDVVSDYCMGSPMHMQQIKQLFLQGCEAGHSGSTDGFSYDNSNGYIVDCEGYKNRNDGFNIHGYGDTVFLNCHGHHNYDDGISHHDGATGLILGGTWHDNVKGGVIPTYGSKVNCYDVTCWGQRFGIYYGASSDDTRREIIISNCRCYNNTVAGFELSTGYDIKLLNCYSYDNAVGIECTGDGGADIRNCTIVDNETNGLAASTTGIVTARDNKISDNGTGIFKDQSGTLNLSRNQVLYNEIGINYAAGTVVTQKRNNLYGNTVDYAGALSTEEKNKNVSFASI